MAEGKITSGLKRGFLSKKARFLLEADDYMSKQEVKKKPCTSCLINANESFSISDGGKYDRLKQEKQLKQPCVSSSLDNNNLDMENA